MIEKPGILVVDDNLNTLVSMEAALAVLDINIVKAGSGREALRLILQQDFAAILIDVNMPDMDGIETATLIRRRKSSEHTPIIFVTATDKAAETELEGYAAGAVDYIFKPVLTKILQAKVKFFVQLYQMGEEIKRKNRELELEVAIRKETEEKLRESEENYRFLVENVPDVTWICDQNGVFKYISPNIEKASGYRVDEILGKSFDMVFESIHPDDVEKVRSKYEALLSSGKKIDIEHRMKRKDGEWSWLTSRSGNVFTKDGNLHTIGVFSDITKRKLAEEALKKKTEELDLFFRLTPDLLCIASTGGYFLNLSSAWEKALGYTCDELKARTFLEFVHEEDIPATLEAVETLKSQNCVTSFTNRYRCMDGSYIWLEWNAIPLGEMICAAGRNITERKMAEDALRHLNETLEQRVLERTAEVMDANRQLEREIVERETAEESLRESEEKYRALVENLNIGIALIDPGLLIISVNKKLKEWFPLIDESQKTWCYKVMSESPQNHICPDCLTILTMQDGKAREKDVDFTIEGKEKIFHSTALPVRDNDGKIIAAIKMLEDITYKKSIERQLLQAQKMESIGTLAGGIAHDFNNILTGIIGYSHLALMELTPSSPLYEDLKEISSGADKAAALTRQILAFSRKQILSPEYIKVTLLIENTQKFLRRVIGEDVELRLSMQKEISTILVDPSQVEQVIFNLCVNARDAMPKGGTITIEACDVSLDEDYCSLNQWAKPGDYVMVSVGDTGYGMDAETLEHIFEPFFTTKEVGRGTGLGLAVVFGIVQQHGGFINVYSEKYKGSIFHIYFKAVEAEAEEIVERHEEITSVSGSETILFVEDDETVRKIASHLLIAGGYTLLSASNGREALEVYREHCDRIDMIISDMVMPEMSGLEMYDRICEMKPAPRVLFLSGYSNLMIEEQVKKMPDFAFIQKPFNPEVFLRKVREVLDR